MKSFAFYLTLKGIDHSPIEAIAQTRIIVGHSSIELYIDTSQHFGGLYAMVPMGLWSIPFSVKQKSEAFEWFLWFTWFEKLDLRWL